MATYGKAIQVVEEVSSHQLVSVGQDKHKTNVNTITLLIYVVKLLVANDVEFDTNKL